jgi:polyhydroxyalkanoate synthesis regulator phasin
MPGSEGFRKYIEAGTVLGQITRARAEEIMKELVSSEDMDRAHAEQWVDELVERSRRASQELVELVRYEVRTQLAALGVDAEDLARQLADVLRRSAQAGRQAATDAEATVDRTAMAARRAAGRAATSARAAAKKKAPSARKPTSVKKSVPAKKAAASKKRAATKKSVPAKKTQKKVAPAQTTAKKKAASAQTTAKKKAAPGTKAVASKKKAAPKKPLPAKKRTGAKQSAAMKRAGS